MCIILMLHVSAIQGHLQATLTRGALLHRALLEYLLFIMSLLFSSYILFVVRLFLYFVGVLLHILSVPLRSLSSLLLWDS
jgi:hypothetical protein